MLSVYTVCDFSCCVWHILSVYTVCCVQCMCVYPNVLLLQEHKPAKRECPAYEIIHLVDFTGFEWKDSTTNCPPRCLTCPHYLKSLTPCIGILTVLSNVPPIQVPNEERPASVSVWLGSSPSLCKPEVFHNRWRTDKDPTQHLVKYSLIPSRVPPRQATTADPRDTLLVPDMMKRCTDVFNFFSGLDDHTRQQALGRAYPIVSQLESLKARFEMDVLIAKTQQVVHYCIL
jgi:hypothetical protein